MLNELTDDPRFEALLTGLGTMPGPRFFFDLVQNAALVFDASCVMLVEPVNDELQTIALWPEQQRSDRYIPSLDLYGAVIKHGTLTCEHSVQERFPEDNSLVELEAEGYVGFALRGTQNSILGILSIIDKKPFKNLLRVEQICKAFAVKATAELERQQIQLSLLEHGQTVDRTNVQGPDQEREEFFQKILDTLPLSIFWKDRNSVYLGCNHTFLQNIGLASKIEIIGKTDYDLSWQEQEADAFRADDKEVIESASAKLGIIETQLQVDGQQRWLETHKIPIYDENNKVVGVLGAFQDITSRKQAEINLQRTNTELADTTRLKNEFLSSMSYKLRTPLNSILGMAEGLQDNVFGAINSQQHNALRTIASSGTHLLELINDILDLSKIESGQIHLNITATTAEFLCTESINCVKHLAFKKRIKLKSTLHPDLPNLMVDERRIRQVLINLLNNAIKYTAEGGTVTLAINIEEQIIDSRRDKNITQPYFKVEISDSGGGIDPVNFDRLFEPFVQFESTNDHQFEGTGLGLALVKKIVELHKGKVNVTSDVGTGSCFTIYIPCSIDSGGSQQEHSSINENIQNYSSIDLPFTPSILFAEDNEANFEAIASYLEAVGCQVIPAVNGLEALRLAQSEKPDLILMDIQMPRMDGLEAIQRIRDMPNFSEIPIIALTALAMEGDFERCLEAGASDYISKPVRIKLLVSKIQQLLTSME